MTVDIWELIDMRISGTSWAVIAQEKNMDWRTAKVRVENHMKKLRDLDKSIRKMKV